MPKTETIRAFAARHGVSMQSVSNWKRAGHVVNADDGHMDSEMSDARLSQRPAYYRGGRTRGPCGERGARATDRRSLGEIGEALHRDAEAGMERLLATVLTSALNKGVFRVVNFENASARA